MIFLAPHVRRVSVRRTVYGGSSAPTYILDYVEGRPAGASASVAGQEERRYWSISAKDGPLLSSLW